MRFPAVQNFENRLRFDKVTEILKVGTFFLRHSVDREDSRTAPIEEQYTGSQAALGHIATTMHLPTMPDTA